MMNSVYNKIKTYKENNLKKYKQETTISQYKLNFSNKYQKNSFKKENSLTLINNNLKLKKEKNKYKDNFKNNLRLISRNDRLIRLNKSMNFKSRKFNLIKLKLNDNNLFKYKI